MMRSLFVVVVLIFVASASLVSAGSVDGVVAATTKTPVAAAPVQEILPLSVHSTDSISTIVATQKTTATVLAREKQTYSEIQTKSLDVSAPEQPVIQAQLSQQRYRYLLALLNSVVVIYQRIDYLISNLDGSLLHLRVLYTQKGKSIPAFDVRIEKLETEWEALHAQSKKVAATLDAVKDSPDMVKSLRGARNDVSTLLGSLRTFLVDYRVLVQDVVQA